MLNDGASLPASLQQRVPTREQLLAHAVCVDADRWRRLTADLGLDQPGNLFGLDRWVNISRGDILRMADGEITPSTATQLLYASLAWGLGVKARRLPTRLESLTNDGVPKRLEHAWTAVREGRSPRECYEVLLTPKGRGRIYYFGPAFSTKYLYFASGTRKTPQCLILDAVVAKNLRPIAWPASPTAAWWSETYGRYCDLLGRWATAMDAPDPVGPDQIEMAIFKLRPGFRPVGARPCDPLVG